jgi:ABC-2 type transport system permease protein
MQWILIKNNFKLILRRKWILLLVIVTPVLLIAMLAGAFKDMMASYESVKSITVGYQMADQSDWQSVIAQINENEGVSIHFQKSETDDMRALLDSGSYDVMVDFDKKDYTVYETKDKEAAGLAVEYCLNEAGEQMMNAKVTQQNGMAESTKSTVVHLEPINLDGAFQVSSKDYYGIIYIVFFSALGIITISSVFSSEQKNKIGARYGIAPVPTGSLYLGKLVPRITIGIVTTLVSAVLSTALYGINWGNPVIAFGIVMLFIIATSCVDVLICYLCKNMALATGIVFAMMWAEGFAGGSFETYLYSSTPQWIKDLDPIYYVNRTLVEYSVMGHSSYTMRCVVYLAAIAVLFLIAGIVIAQKKEGEVSE